MNACFFRHIGKLVDDATARNYLKSVPDLMGTRIYQTGDFAYFQIEKYGILTLFESHEKSLNTERLYLVHLFLEQGAQAIANVELHETLLRKEKLSAVGQALSMIAHDLKGPIGSICQSIELVEEMADHREFVKDMHRMMLDEAEKSLNMVNDILDFTRNSGLTKSSVDIKQFVAAVQKSAAECLQELGVDLRIRIEKPFYFPADESKMQRVLSNLIKNAAEAHRQSKNPQPNIIFSAETRSDGFCFRVEDNGPGIPDQVRDQLFVPFVTYDKKGGTGLGLAIVKQFVEAHSGEISVETSSKGTKFTLFLPDK